MGDCEISKGFDPWNAIITQGEDPWSTEARQDSSTKIQSVDHDIVRLRVVELEGSIANTLNDPPQLQTDEVVETDIPTRTWSTSICEINDELILRYPLTVSLEDYAGREVIASWPEVEAWGSGTTDFEAINALKEEIALLYEDLLAVPDAELGKLPKRWKRALNAVIFRLDASSK